MPSRDADTLPLAPRELAPPKPPPTGDLAALLRVLGDDTRLRIFAMLPRAELCVCEIVEALGKPQSTVSHHLFLLQNAGLIRSRKQGRWIMYSINDEVFDQRSVFLGGAVS